MSLKLKCPLNWSVTKTEMSLKLKCHFNCNVTLIFRCASISSSDDRDWLTHSLTDSLADWKLTVPYYLSSHHWDWDCDWIDLIDWNVRNWNVTETEMSLKLKCHWHWNVIKTEMSLKHQWNWKVTETEMSLKLKCHWNWNDTKTKMLMKLKCNKLKLHWNWNVTETEMS